jgi:RNA polymerase sigma factor (sigma-70 family)
VRDAHSAIEAVWRIESARLIGGLTRLVGDLGLAEDFAQDALVAALEQWPATGTPKNPGAWLMTIAKRRAVDSFRRRERLERKHELLVRDLEAGQAVDPDLAEAVDAPVTDDVLRLIFMCCHPVLSRQARVALTLRVLGGLTTEEIAHAFLTSEPAIAQRIVRAKRTLAEQQVSFEAPTGSELQRRLASVLEVVYLIFNEGYAATSGDTWVRPELCEEALRLGRMTAALAPDESEAHGLVALMEIQASRMRARVGPGGELVLLLDQDRSRWDRLLIRRGLAALDRARKATSDLGPYALQAEIAACHARAATPAETDWGRIAAGYALLGAVTPSPVVELNRGVAVGMAFGPGAGLRIVDRLRAEPSLRRYHLLPSVRGDLLARLGRVEEAREEFRRAADLCANNRERELLLARAQQ